MLGLVCDLLRARVTAKKDSVILRLRKYMCEDLVTHLTLENLDTPRTPRSRNSL